MISNGGIAVCEATCFKEPILIYGKGAAINLYQVIMNTQLEFQYVAVSANYYVIKDNEVIISFEQLDGCGFLQHKGIPPKTR